MMRTMLSIRSRAVCTAVTFSATMLACAFGCSQKPSNDYNLTQSDQSLTLTQRQAKTPDPFMVYYQIMGLTLSVGCGLLLTAYLWKRRADAAVQAEIDIEVAAAAPVNISKSKVKKPVDLAREESSGWMPQKFVDLIEHNEHTEEKLPETQEEVDAIPRLLRSVSFFSSRPLPISEVVDVKVRVGHSNCTVTATKKEAEQCVKGQIPHIRAFTVKGKTIPWYELERYNPYKHFCGLQARDWIGSRNIIACFLHPDDCDPSLSGFHKMYTD